MRMLSSMLLLFVAIVTAVAVLNWHVIVAPVDLSLGFATVNLPPALLLLALLGLVSMLFLAYAAYLQGSALMDTRRLNKDLLASRELADKAEASRFTELRVYITQTLAMQQQEVLARIEQLERSTETMTEQAGNSLAASIGELEDRVVRLSSVPAAQNAALR